MNRKVLVRHGLCVTHIHGTSLRWQKRVTWPELDAEGLELASQWQCAMEGELSSLLLMVTYRILRQ